MKTLFKTSGAVLVSAAVLLGACGTTANTSKTVGTKPSKTGTTTVAKKVYGWTGKGHDTLKLPYVGQASPTITTFAAQDNAFYKEIINPADWVKSKTFGQYIFVGPYTTGVSYQRIRDAKIFAMDTMELYTLDANYKQTWPSVLNGFNYDAFNEGPTSQSFLTSFYKSEVSYGHPAMTADVPSEATIVESPVGLVTAAQMNNPKGQPQYITQGICVPHAFNIKYTSGKSAVGNSLGSSTTQEYFAGYGNPSVLILNLTANNGFTNGVEGSPVKSCANFS
jgi:hypothetical protein